MVRWYSYGHLKASHQWIQDEEQSTQKDDSNQPARFKHESRWMKGWQSSRWRGPLLSWYACIGNGGRGCKWWHGFVSAMEEEANKIKGSRAAHPYKLSVCLSSSLKPWLCTTMLTISVHVIYYATRSCDMSLLAASQPVSHTIHCSFFISPPATSWASNPSCLIRLEKSVGKISFWYLEMWSADLR